jgi:hypothetical protein
MNCYIRPLMLAAALFGNAMPSVSYAASPTEPINAALTISPAPMVPLEDGWKDPPRMARTQCWWWWLNGNVTKEGITRDLEEMQAGVGKEHDAGTHPARHRQVPWRPTSDAGVQLFCTRASRSLGLIGPTCKAVEPAVPGEAGHAIS